MIRWFVLFLLVTTSLFNFFTSREKGKHAREPPFEVLKPHFSQVFRCSENRKGGTRCGRLC